MKWTPITANGTTVINQFSGSVSGEVSIYRDFAGGSATVVIGFLDSDGEAVALPDGAFIGNEFSRRFKIGSGVDVVAIVTNYTTPFKIGYAPG